MRTTLLEILQCPFCGSRLSPIDGASLSLCEDELRAGLLRCACDTIYPVVDGIPVFQVDYLAEEAKDWLGQGQPERALFAMLGLDDSRQEAFQRFLDEGMRGGYREAIEILHPDAEGLYFLYRYSDPTYLTSQAVVRALGQHAGGRRLDLCGGSGHLARALARLSPSAEVVLADTGFVKLWLARRINAPACQPVCCDANNPLPFAAETFSLVVCSDAYHYIWSKRLLACEMTRLTEADGIVALPHVHNALCENVSAGMPLPPANYRALFASHGARLFGEPALFADFLERGAIDLSATPSDEALADAPALVIVASRRQDIFRAYESTPDDRIDGALRVNPLYRIEERGERTTLTRHFPSDTYAREYAACERYLPERLTVPTETLRKLAAGEINEEHRALARQYVLLDVPRGYC